MLEDHRDLLAAELSQPLGGVLEDVFAVEPDMSLGGLDETDQAAYQGGLSAAGQPHHDEDLADADVERHVPQCDHRSQLFLNLRTAFGGVLRLQRSLRLVAENLPETVDLYLMSLLDHVTRPPNSPCVRL